MKFVDKEPQHFQNSYSIFKIRSEFCENESSRFSSRDNVASFNTFAVGEAIILVEKIWGKTDDFFKILIAKKHGQSSTFGD